MRGRVKIASLLFFHGCNKNAIKELIAPTPQTDSDGLTTCHIYSILDRSVILIQRGIHILFGSAIPLNEQDIYKNLQKTLLLFIYLLNVIFTTWNDRNCI
jgi:hypothetical protein